MVLRLLCGESLDAVSREVGVEVYRLEAWKARALAGIELGLKAQAGEPLTLTAEETKALCHEMAQTTLNATNASKTALAAMERVAALETAAAEPPVVH